MNNNDRNDDWRNDYMAWWRNQVTWTPQAKGGRTEPDVRSQHGHNERPQQQGSSGPQIVSKQTRSNR